MCVSNSVCVCVCVHACAHGLLNFLCAASITLQLWWNWKKDIVKNRNVCLAKMFQKQNWYQFDYGNTIARILSPFYANSFHQHIANNLAVICVLCQVNEPILCESSVVALRRCSGTPGCLPLCCLMALRALPRATYDSFDLLARER